MVLSSYTEDRRDQDGIWRIYVKPGVKMRTAAESFGRVNGADVLTVGPRGRWAHLRDIHGRELTIFADGVKGHGEGRWLTPGEEAYCDA